MRGKISILNRILFGPILVQMQIVKRCNLRCAYCNEYDTKSPPVPVHTVEQRLEKIRSLGALAIDLTGGEPLLHPDIAAIIARATQLGFSRRAIITNAFLLDEEKIDALNSAGLNHMQISVDGVQPNDTTVKVLVKLERRLKLLAARAKFPITLSAVIGATPPEEAREVIQFARDNRMRPRVLLLHNHEGRINLSAEQRKHYALIKKSLAGIFKEAHGYRERLIAGQPAPFKCRAGSRYFYVSHTGQVRWCSQCESKFNKDLMDYEVSDLREQFQAAKSCSAYCTIGCARSASKFDQWRSQAQPKRIGQS